MIDYDQNQPLIFIHIPKTAGVSVREIFGNWFAGNIHQHYFDSRSNRLPVRHDLASLQKPGKPALVYGHFNARRGFGVPDYYNEVRQFITIVREPWERAVSGYFYTKNTAERLAGAGNVSRRQTFEEHLLDPRKSMLNFFPRRPTEQNYKDIIEEYFIEIGIVDSLVESISRIARKLHRQFDPQSLQHLNKSNRDVPVPEHLKDRFREIHQLDYLVYEYISNKY